ncbi:acetolactate synthase-1/2/3 large subunit [Sinobaca qinghaiensis]|uniref:Acetolactate synthase-1/2/3 large subunit n=1 Tax=Sinobaca qinghaiensis TaxID=342944 RepID=A0A419V4D0_9BACL|nr:thiamine pyrophosphate-binding protein [Sinobaca qinghaiensis]RKD73367.1 acetolactate synthase-1/2/3 large subunit [Sinobaca qinghaiensis]
MKTAHHLVEYLKSGGIEYIFGIPAGSVNAFFDELYEEPGMEPVITKHEGAAGYMACAYAKYSQSLSVCVGSSGPGATNFITGAANAMREQLPVLFLTGAVPIASRGLNASQELNVADAYESLVKYSVTISSAEAFMPEIEKAVSIAMEGVPGPVHVALPIDLQLTSVEEGALSPFPSRVRKAPSVEDVQQTAEQLNACEKGIIFAGQGIRQSADEVEALAEQLQWPIITSPQAKGIIADSHPRMKGIFGFAGMEEASEIMNDADYQTVLVLGSSLGETATNNWNPCIANGRYVIQADHDPAVFDRKYPVDLRIESDLSLFLKQLLPLIQPKPFLEENSGAPDKEPKIFNTQTVLHEVQSLLPADTRYIVDIGEFMAYVVHHMNVLEKDTFDINVHFGAMGSAIGGAIGAKIAQPDKPSACITGDGCFFMHGMEILTAKEYNLPVVFIVINNARLGMVHHGHSLQYKRAHHRFSQKPVSIKAMVEAMGIPAFKASSLEELEGIKRKTLMKADGPSLLEIELVDEQVPPMGDRVKFLSSFGK